MAERYYVSGAIEPGPMILTGPEAHHLSQVCRSKSGESITLFNGDGAEYAAMVETIKKHQVELNIIERRAVSREAKREVTIACPLPKGDRAGFLIEKLTELGVARYIPLRTQRSVVHPGEGKTEKLRRYVIEASKQCGRNVLMQVDDLVGWLDLAARPELPAQRLLADPLGEGLEGGGSTAETIVSLGPEGGWTEEELQQGRHSGWQVIKLGPSILRIETAAIAFAARLLG